MMPCRVSGMPTEGAHTSSIMRSGARVVALDDGTGHWLTFALTPVEYERAVAELMQAAGHEVVDWRVQHLDPLRRWTAYVT